MTNDAHQANIINIRRLNAAVLFALVLSAMADLPGGGYISIFSNQVSLLKYGITPLLFVFVYFSSQFSRKITDTFRTAVLVLLMLSFLGGLLAHQISSRQAHGPASYIIDGAVQTEEAAKMLFQGRNPYKIDYQTTTFGTYSDQLDGTRPHPGMTHYVYLPGTFLLTAPVQFISNHLLGWFDVRWIYVTGFAIMLIILSRMVAPPHRDLVLILAAFNPFTARLLLFGVNDFLVLAGVLGAVCLLQRGKMSWSSVSLGLALTMKQSAWIFLPFYLIAVSAMDRSIHWKKRFQALWPGAVTVLLAIVPFMIWSLPDFFDDVWRFPNGMSVVSYPASGIGLSQWLVTFGVIRDAYSHYPMWIFTLLIGIPVALLLMRRQWHSNTPANLVWYYAFSSLAIWFTARYFNDTHLVYLILLFTMAPFLSNDQYKKVTDSHASNRPPRKIVRKPL